MVVTEFAGPEVGKVYAKVNALLGGDVIPGSDAAARVSVVLLR